jgi:hypothetical protein
MPLGPAPKNLFELRKTSKPTQSGFDDIHNNLAGVDVGDDLSSSLRSVCPFSQKKDGGVLWSLTKDSRLRQGGKGKTYKHVAH